MIQHITRLMRSRIGIKGVQDNVGVTLVEVKDKTSAAAVTKTKNAADEANSIIDEKSTAFCVRPNGIPQEILRLLWFSDGPMKNYTNSAKHKSKMIGEDFIIEVSFMGAEEPSSISLALPVKEPTNVESVERPQYFPSYSSLSPQQRWIYLDWVCVPILLWT